jgi:hypothetical protein
MKTTDKEEENKRTKEMKKGEDEESKGQEQ